MIQLKGSIYIVILLLLNINGLLGIDNRINLT